jgi:genome maintenance exonuclease 1
MKKFTHIPPPKDIQELKTIQEDDGRFYLAPGEKRYPSVTTVVGYEKQKFFAKWRRENPEEAKRTSDRGNVLHEACENYLNNEPVREMEQNEKMLFANMRRSIDRIDNVRALEVPLWSHTLKLAGRVDCVGEFDGKLSIIDFKGSTRRKSPSNITNYFCQATAYSIMWQEMMEEEIQQIVILISSEDGANQVFVKKPIDYVGELKRSIDLYENDMLRKKNLSSSPNLFLG